MTKSCDLLYHLSSAFSITVVSFLDDLSLLLLYRLLYSFYFTFLVSVLVCLFIHLLLILPYCEVPVHENDQKRT